MHRGKVHDYLGMTIDFTDVGKVEVEAVEEVEEVVEMTEELAAEVTNDVAGHIKMMKLTT